MDGLGENAREGRGQDRRGGGRRREAAGRWGVSGVSCDVAAAAAGGSGGREEVEDWRWRSARRNLLFVVTTATSVGGDPFVVRLHNGRRA